MGVTCSCLRQNNAISSMEQELLIIRNHPNRVKRRSSIAPNAPQIKESKWLEEMCETSGIEPHVPADRMGTKDLAILVRRLSQVDRAMRRSNRPTTDAISSQSSLRSYQKSSLNEILETLAQG